MNEGKFLMFRNRLSKVYRHLSKQAKAYKVSCYRVYDHDIPEFPFSIELYEDKVYVAEYKRNHEMDEEAHETWLEECIVIISEILKISADNIYVRLRQRKQGRLGQYQKIADAEIFYIVNENGLSFKINLTNYLDTGLFLDHRITRAMVKEESANKRVLNLFCYTGSFSVYAASGGAVSVTSVDLSRTYLNWAKENMELNHFEDDSRYFYLHEDVKQYLESIRKNSFDLVIIDPPTFSNSKRMKDFLDIQRDYPTLLNQCLNALSDNGVIYFSTNFRRFQLDRALIKNATVKDITNATTPFDFRGKLFRWCYRIDKITDA